MPPKDPRRSASDGMISQALRWSAAKLAVATDSQVARHAAAKQAADGAVKEFAARVRRGDEPQLAKELKRAYRRDAEEGVRNAMVATCRRLELWPPSPASIKYCQTYGRNKLPVVAQGLYDEEAARQGGEVDMARRARTAAFLADFGDAVGAARAPMSESQAAMLQGFNELALRWEEDAHKREADPVVSIHVRDHKLWNPCETDHLVY